MTPAQSLPQRFFVTGTDTDVGKSVFCALVLANLGGHYWKPVQSGLDSVSDTDSVTRMAGLEAGNILPEAHRLTQPLSPHAAAEIDGVDIQLSDFSLPDIPPGERLIVEGAGGVMVPLNSGLYMIDLMAHLALPVVLVAKSGLGTINHTLLSLSALRTRGLNVAGVVFNGPPNPGNRKAVEDFGNIRVLAQMTPLKNLSPTTLAKAFLPAFERDEA